MAAGERVCGGSEFLAQFGLVDTPTRNELLYRRFRLP
jgi:hypothetical protein